jgi:NADPH:quinone reductase-like Zn-dependent oxidoreductase
MGIERWLRGMLVAPFLRLKVRPLVHKDFREDLVTIESGKVMPILDKTYPLAKVSNAIQYVTEGHARGRVVISIAYSAKVDNR